MKIAIYGDSFGNHYLDNIPGDNIDRGKAWVELLADKYQVTNFSYPGSSLFYSYKIFLENNKNFDYNIFLVTEPNRITLPEESIIPEKGMNPHINLKIIDGLSRFDDSNQTLISAIKLYYGLIHNSEAINTFHNLMVENITRINQNTVVIPCFYNSSPYNNQINNLQGIASQELYDNKIIETLEKNDYIQWTPIKDENVTWTYYSYSKCHLNEENNKILYNIIEDAINNKQQNINLDLNQFVKATKDIEYYYLYISLNKPYFERRLNGELHNLYNKLLIDT